MASRIFVSFSSTDIDCFNLMKAWKENEHIDFNFIDMQIKKGIDSENEQYIKSILRKKITNSGTFIQLIGKDTKSKHKYVRWEADVAIEKNCRLIGVNLNNLIQMDNNLTPPILKNKGVLFIIFSPEVLKHALNNFKKKGKGNFSYKDKFYTNLGFEIK